MVSFTGSTPVGRAIGEVAGRDMKRLLLELGGKGAGIVFDDADLKTAIGTIVSRVGVPQRPDLHGTHPRDRAARRLRPGGRRPPAGGRPPEGRRPARARHGGRARSSPRLQRDRVEALIQTGRASRAASSWPAATRPDMDTGFYVAPTLIAGLQARQRRRCMQEFFGPVVVVVPFDDEDEAVAIANGTEFGLYDYVFSADTARAMRVAKQLRTGNVGINTAQRNHEAPFGGFKMSGVGRDGGSFGLHAYSELQSIVWPG